MLLLQLLRGRSDALN